MSDVWIIAIPVTLGWLGAFLHWSQRAYEWRQEARDWRDRYWDESARRRFVEAELAKYQPRGPFR